MIKLFLGSVVLGVAAIAYVLYSADPRWRELSNDSLDAAIVDAQGTFSEMGKQNPPVDAQATVAEALMSMRQEKAHRTVKGAAMLFLGAASAMHLLSGVPRLLRR